jgi:hypothetical protein
VIQNIPLYGEMHRFIPALASWYGASICEIPIKNVNRERGKSHYGIGRTFRVFFDLLTIRFLLKYMSRPLHFFGGFGALGILVAACISAYLLASSSEPAPERDGSARAAVCDWRGADCRRHSDAGHRPAGRVAGAALLHQPASARPTPSTAWCAWKCRANAQSSAGSRPGFRRVWLTKRSWWVEARVEAA